MNLQGLLDVLTKWLGTEVVDGTKRGPRAVHDRAPLPSAEAQLKAYLSVQTDDSPGRGDIRRTWDPDTQKLKEIVTTYHVAQVGLRVEAFKGSNDRIMPTLTRFMNTMRLPAFKADLHAAGFGLADVGMATRINYQADAAGFLEFTLAYAESQPSSPDIAWIETVEITQRATGGVEDPYDIIYRVPTPT